MGVTYGNFNEFRNILSGNSVPGNILIYMINIILIISIRTYDLSIKGQW